MECPICLDELTRELYVTLCGHAFHSACLDRYRRELETPSCPEDDAADQMRPFPGARQRRKQPRQQKHAGLHHGGRMQIGGYRRRRRHRVR